jgi:hypothetical protein
MTIFSAPVERDRKSKSPLDLFLFADVHHQDGAGASGGEMSDYFCMVNDFGESF